MKYKMQMASHTLYSTKDVLPHRFKSILYHCPFQNFLLCFDVNVHLCKLPSESAITTWSSAKSRVSIFVLVDKVMPFVLYSFISLLFHSCKCWIVWVIKMQPCLTPWLCVLLIIDCLSLLLFCFQSKFLLYFLTIKWEYLCIVIFKKTGVF
jgi:hypothetical protein